VPFTQLLVFQSWHLWQGTVEIGLGVTLD